MNFETFLSEQGESLSVAAGEHVFRQGDHDRQLYFVAHGLLKAYYLSADGKESTKSFIQGGSTIGSLNAAFENRTCTFSVLALEPSDLVQIHADRLMQAIDESESIARTMIDLLMQLAMKKERREFEFLTLAAEDRYQRFCEREPDLEARLPQSEIARYLGITPVALSRIRKRLRDQG